VQAEVVLRKALRENGVLVFMTGTWQVAEHEGSGRSGSRPIRPAAADGCFAPDLQRFGASFLAQTYQQVCKKPVFSVCFSVADTGVGLALLVSTC
jgi:hypothetical protein